MGMTTEEFWKKYGSQNSDSSSNNVTGENQPMTTDTFWQTYGSQEDLDARNFTRQFNKYKAEYDRLEQEEKKKAEQDRIQQEQNRPGLLGTMMASFQANLSDEKAGSSLKEALSGEREQFISPVNASGQPSQIGVRFLDTGERKQLPADQFNMLSPEGTIQLSKEERQKSLERFKTFSEEAKKYAEEAKRGGENSWFKQTAGDVAGSAKSYLSIPAAAVGSLAGPSGSAMGAVLGGIPAARQAFYTSYGQIAPYLLEQGVEPEKADEIATIYAVRQAGEEYAFELIPGIGKLKFGKNYFTRLASTGIKEAGSEVATELLQNADSYLSEQFADDPKVKSAFRKMNAESESDYVRVASAGLLGATAIGAVTTPMELAGERRAAAYDNLKKFLEAADPDTQEGAATANQALREAGVEPIADVTEQDTTAQDRGIDVTGPDLMRNPPPIEEAPVPTPTAEKPRVRIVDGEVVPVAPTEAEAQQVTPTVTPEVAPEAETTVEAPQQAVEVESPITGTRKRKVVDDRQQAAEEVSQPLSPEDTAAFRTEVAQKLTDMGISEQEAAEIAQADPNPRELVEPVTPQREEAAIKEQRLVPPNPRVQTEVQEMSLEDEIENSRIRNRVADSPVIRKTYEQETSKPDGGNIVNVLKAAKMDAKRTTPYLNSYITFLETMAPRIGIKVAKFQERLDNKGRVRKAQPLAYYDVATHSIALREASPESVAHEVSHGLTMALMRDEQALAQSPDLLRAVQDIRKLYTTVKDQVLDKQSWEVSGFSDMRRWFTNYGIKDVYEFVAVGMTNPEFQQFLKRVPDPTKPRRSMWQSLKDFLVKALKSVGMSDIQGTALDALMDNFSTMMAVAAKNPEMVQGAVGRMKENAQREAGPPQYKEMSIPSRRATSKKKEENAKKKAATAESKAGFVAPATPASDVKAVADTLKQSWASKYLFGDPEKETAKDYLHNPFRNALRVVQRMLSSSRGVPVKLKEIIGWFHASTRKSVIQAEQYKNKIVYGISEINKKSPEKAEAILKAIDIAGNSELTVDEKAQAKERGQSYSEFVKERRLSAEAALRRADKKVYDDYRIFRELLDKNSVRMIRDIMKKRVLTDADAAKVRVIANNMGSYLTRAYRAHQGKHGKKYAKNLWKKWEDYKEGKIDADEDTEVVENALSRLKSYYTIGNFDEVDSVTGGQKELPLSALEALHEQWIARDETKVTPLRKNATEDQKQDYADGLIAELLSKKEELGSKEYENTLNAEAEKAAKGLLGLIDNIPNLVSIFKSVARQDMTILKERKLPVELRKLLGEITDPLVRMQSTAVAQATYIHRNKMLEEMLAVGKGVYFEDKAKADPDRFTAQMTGETLGPLEGLTATPRAAEIVKIFADLSKNMETTMKMALLPGREAEVAQNIIIAGLKKLGRLANVWKFGVVLLKPSNWFNNGVGGFLTVLKDGGAKPHHFAQAYRATSGLIGPAFKKYLPEETQRAIEMGMTDSSQAGELSEQLHQSLVDEALGPDGQTAWRRFSKWRKKKLFIFTDRYQALDLFWRTVAAFSEYEYQEKLAKAQGENLTQEQIARRAGVRMRARHMSYRDAMLLPKILEKGLFTTFITYHSETLRSWANTYLQGFQEIYEGQKQGGKAGTLKIKAGTQKVIGTTLAITARYHILKWLGSAIGYGIRGGVDLVSELYRMVTGDADDEDKARRERLRADAEKMERIKASMAKYHQSQMWDLFSVSKEGVPSFWEPGRLDPIDPTTNVLYGLMEGDVDKALSSAVGLLSGNPGAYGLVDLAIYAGKTVLNKAESNATAENPKKPSLARRYPETYERFRTGLYNAGVPKKVTDTLFFGAQLIGEPVMRPTMGLLAVDEDTKGKPVGPTILRAAGVQMAVLDKNYYQQTLRYEVQNEFAKTRKWLKDNIKPGTSKDRLRDDYAEAIEKERELANRAKEVVRGMQALGWEEDDIKEVLSNSGMSKTKQQEALSSTTMITSTILSERVLQGLIDDETMTRVELQTLIDAAGIRGIELEDKKEKGEKKERSFGGMRGTKWR